MKCLLKSLGQIQCANAPQCLSWNQDFFLTHLPGEQLCPSPYTFLARQSYLSQKSFAQRKEMPFD